MGQRRRSTTGALVVLAASAAAAVLFLSPPRSACADIYRWVDGSGVIHFTDDLSTVPPKFRGKTTEILKGPPAAGEPSLSTMGSPAGPPGAYGPPPVSNPEDMESPAEPQEDRSGEAERLRAKIDAKERFLKEVDKKQSLATNPYRNRFVSPGDLELYRKYKEELPVDREHLRELESRLPSGDRP
jgi:hypothetical protein